MVSETETVTVGEGPTQPPHLTPLKLSTIDLMAFIDIFSLNQGFFVANGVVALCTTLYSASIPYYGGSMTHITARDCMIERKKWSAAGFSLKGIALALGLLITSVASSSAESFPDGLSARALRKANRKGVNVAALGKVCSSTKPLSGLLIKAEISHHISPGDARSSGYTAVCGRSCVSFPAKFYYCDGSLAGSFGYYGTWEGNGQPRAYGGAGGAPAHSVRAIQANARRKKCGSQLHLQTRKNKSACLSWNANSSRTGSPF